jgi:hypothetical protein
MAPSPSPHSRWIGPLTIVGLVVLGSIAIRFAVLLDSDCLANPVGNVRCGERDIYAYAGYALWAAAVVATSISAVQRFRSRQP